MKPKILALVTESLAGLSTRKGVVCPMEPSAASEDSIRSLYTEAESLLREGQYTSVHVKNSRGSHTLVWRTETGIHLGHGPGSAQHYTVCGDLEWARYAPLLAPLQALAKRVTQKHRSAVIGAIARAATQIKEDVALVAPPKEKKPLLLSDSLVDPSEDYEDSSDVGTEDADEAEAGEGEEAADEARDEEEEESLPKEPPAFGDLFRLSVETAVNTKKTDQEVLGGFSLPEVPMPSMGIPELKKKMTALRARAKKGKTDGGGSGSVVEAPAESKSRRKSKSKGGD